MLTPFLAVCSRRCILFAHGRVRLAPSAAAPLQRKSDPKEITVENHFRCKLSNEPALRCIVVHKPVDPTVRCSPQHNVTDLLSRPPKKASTTLTTSDHHLPHLPPSASFVPKLGPLLSGTSQPSLHAQFHYSIHPDRAGTENVMAEPPPESSRTPPSSPLSEPNPPAEHSMEDRDTQGTRKRPRLDSGSRVGESLSIEGASLTPAAPASDMDVTPDPDPEAEQAAPSNKMTINVKSPGPAKSPAPAMDPEPPQSPRPQPPGTDAQPQSLEPDVPSADANVISISSSPAQSPEIEVAELEDMDQDPNTSNWRPLEEALREQGQPELVQVDEMASLVDSFPKVRERLSARENLNKICQMIESGMELFPGFGGATWY